MNPAKIGILFVKEIRQGATNFFFAYALVMPIVLSLMVMLVFGNLFSETPRLGIYDAGDSEIVAELVRIEHIETTVYTNESALRDDVERGAVSAGVIFPEGFDAARSAGDDAELTLIQWSQSLASSVAIITSTLDQLMGQAEDPLITVEAVQLGEASTISWTERLLPVIVLMTIVLGGILVPATSLVDEKQRRTLSALTVTPVSLLDVYIAKALMGIAMSTIMGLIVLVLNNAFGGQPALLVTVLVMGAVAASVFGVMVGSFVSDINALLAVFKAGGVILLAPALIQLAPDIPQWIGRVFPTYYVLNPVLEVSQDGASLGDIAGDMAILLAIIGVMVLAMVFILERQQKQLALAN